MTNPYIAILKGDNRSSILSSFFFVLLFGGIYYFFERESIYILVSMYFVSVLYVLTFMKSVTAKHKMLLMFPATTKQLIHALYTFIMRTFILLALAILPLYLLASTFDDAVAPLSETIMLYVAVVGTVCVYGAISILLYFMMEDRRMATLTEFVSLILVTFISFSVLTTFERVDVHVALQAVVLVVLFSAAIISAYKLTIKHSQKSNVL